MSVSPESNRCEHSKTTCAYALGVLPPGEWAAAEAHIRSCADCRRELASLQPVIGQFAAWPTDVLRPASSLKTALMARIAAEREGQPPTPASAPRWSEPDWQQVAPGIECKLLATDEERRRVSMLVRLAPRATYPAHTHAGIEELHLLDGELWIDGRKLAPGGYSYGEAGRTDKRVWSETGCTCLLVTSTDDILATSAEAL